MILEYECKEYGSFFYGWGVRQDLPQFGGNWSKSLKSKVY